MMGVEVKIDPPAAERKPRKKKDWAPVYVDYERYAALREAEKQAKEASAEADPPSESQ